MYQKNRTDNPYFYFYSDDGGERHVIDGKLVEVDIKYDLRQQDAVARSFVPWDSIQTDLKNPISVKFSLKEANLNEDLYAALREKFAEAQRQRALTVIDHPYEILFVLSSIYCAHCGEYARYGIALRGAGNNTDGVCGGKPICLNCLFTLVWKATHTDGTATTA